MVMWAIIYYDLLPFFFASDKQDKITHMSFHLSNSGVCHMYTKDMDKAKERLQAALQISKHDITYKMLGKCYLTEHNIEVNY